MNKSKLATKIIALFTVGALTLSLAACGNGSKQENTSTEATSTTASIATDEKGKEPVTIKCVILEAGSGSVNWNDMANSTVAQDIKEKTGVILQIEADDENKYNVMLASGDLPDMLRASPTQFKQLIEGGNVIPLDDLIQSNGQNILKTIPKTIEFSKKNWSAGQNKTYFLPAQVGLDGMGAEASMGFVTRWDYYKELGYPEIKNEDDLLNVLSEMVKKHPQTTDGKKVYGVSGWSDWGMFQYAHPMSCFYGYGGWASDSMTVNNDTNEITCSLTDMDAPFWKSVSFYYKANKLGIFDPDTFTMKNADFQTKATNGQVLSGPATWSMGQFNSNNAKDGKGYMTIPLDWGSQWNGINYYTGWADKSYGITKSAQRPDKVMDLMNYLWSYDGCRTLYSGAKGINWNMVNDQPKLKDEIINAKLTVEGDEWKKTGIQQLSNWTGLSPFTVNPEDNAPLNLFENSDVYAKSLTLLTQDYCDHYGVKYPAEIFAKKLAEGKNKNQSNFDSIAGALMPTAPDDIKRVEAKLKDLATKYATKCILSKSDAEYESNKKKALDEFKATGVDNVADWYTKAWNDARASAGAK